MPVKVIREGLSFETQIEQLYENDEVLDERLSGLEREMATTSATVKQIDKRTDSTDKKTDQVLKLVTEIQATVNPRVAKTAAQLNAHLQRHDREDEEAAHDEDVELKKKDICIRKKELHINVLRIALVILGAIWAFIEFVVR